MVKIVDVSGWPEDSSGNNQGRGSGNASTGASSGGQFTNGGARAGATGASSSVPLRFSTTATGGTGDSGIQSGLVYVFPPRQDVQQRQQQQRKNRRFDSQEELEQILRRGSRGPRVPPTGSMPGQTTTAGSGSRSGGDGGGRENCGQGEEPFRRFLVEPEYVLKIRKKIEMGRVCGLVGVKWSKRTGQWGYKAALKERFLNGTFSWEGGQKYEYRKAFAVQGGRLKTSIECSKTDTWLTRFRVSFEPGVVQLNNRVHCKLRLPVGANWILKMRSTLACPTYAEMGMKGVHTSMEDVEQENDVVYGGQRNIVAYRNLATNHINEENNSINNGRPQQGLCNDTENAAEAMMSMLANTEEPSLQLSNVSNTAQMGSGLDLSAESLSSDVQRALSLRADDNRPSHSARASGGTSWMNNNTKYFAMNDWQLHITQVSAILTL